MTTELPFSRTLLPRGLFAGGLALITWLAIPTAAEAVEGRPCGPEPTIDVVLAYGDLINCAIGRVGDTDEFVFEGAAGDRIRVRTSQRAGGTPCFEVFDPDGGSLGRRCGDRDYDLPVSGVYGIAVNELSNDGTTQYALALERIAPPSPAARPLQDGALINDEINGIGDIDAFFFEGVAGGSARVQAARRSGGTPCFEVFDPDGGSLGRRCGTRDYDLTITGIHSILVNELVNDGTTRYALTLTCSPAGTCPPPVSRSAVSGCIAREGSPLVNVPVALQQPGEAGRTTRTDIRGCYAFGSIVAGKTFRVVLAGPAGG